MEQIVLSPIPLNDFRAIIGEEVQAALQLMQPSTPKQPEPATLPQLITRKEAAKFLGISLPTLHKYTQDGIIPAYRLGAHVRYKADELKTALAAMYNHKNQR